jgi:hypothetical protein
MRTKPVWFYPVNNFSGSVFLIGVPVQPASSLIDWYKKTKREKCSKIAAKIPNFHTIYKQAHNIPIGHMYNIPTCLKYTKWPLNIPKFCILRPLNMH